LEHDPASLEKPLDDRLHLEPALIALLGAEREVLEIDEDRDRRLVMLVDIHVECRVRPEAACPASSAIPVAARKARMGSGLVAAAKASAPAYAEGVPTCVLHTRSAAASASASRRTCAGHSTPPTSRWLISSSSPA